MSSFSPTFALLKNFGFNFIEIYINVYTQQV